MDEALSPAGPLISRLKKEGLADLLIPPEEAKKALGPNTLLVILDTHLASFLECPALYETARHVVIIDHHRRAAGHITNAVVFYHDPGASSASEMVAELLQYMRPAPQVGRLEADALLAGLMLDTRDFVLRTGVRTFEAAAWLRGKGADTVRVKRFFASSQEAHRLKTRIMNEAKTFCGCAVAVADFDAPDLRVICAQAADALLTIEDVDGAFVLFESGGQIHISARSWGAVNVQLMMEQLGGGGHRTMAAAQLDAKAESLASGLDKLQAVIQAYYAENGERG
jgi:c-di-AMP phosphodiesterase-like protein